jgi:hypothetical protein
MAIYGNIWLIYYCEYMVLRWQKCGKLMVSMGKSSMNRAFIAPDGYDYDNQGISLINDACTLQIVLF